MMLFELLTKKYPGMRQWLTQRLTAVIMAVYITLLVVLLLILRPANYAAWMSLVSAWWWKLATLLFFLSLCMHAWLGVRDVFKDYIFNQNLRSYMQAIVDVLLVLYVLWMIVILFSI